MATEHICTSKTGLHYYTTSHNIYSEVKDTKVHLHIQGHDEVNRSANREKGKLVMFVNRHSEMKWHNNDWHTISKQVSNIVSPDDNHSLALH